MASAPSLPMAASSSAASESMSAGAVRDAGASVAATPTVGRGCVSTCCCCCCCSSSSAPGKRQCDEMAVKRDNSQFFKIKITQEHTLEEKVWAHAKLEAAAGRGKDAGSLGMRQAAQRLSIDLENLQANVQRLRPVCLALEGLGEVCMCLG